MFCHSTFYLRALIIGIYPVAASAGGLASRSRGGRDPPKAVVTSTLGLSLVDQIQPLVCYFSPAGAKKTHNNDKVPCCRRRKRCERKPYTCAKCKDGRCNK